MALSPLSHTSQGGDLLFKYHDVRFVTSPCSLTVGGWGGTGIEIFRYCLISKIILILSESNLEFKRSAVKISCLYKTEALSLTYQIKTISQVIQA